jgi:hypothetical protein
LENNTIAIGHRYDFTSWENMKGKMVFINGDKHYHITEVLSETVFSFDTEYPLCPGFGEGIYGGE